MRQALINAINSGNVLYFYKSNEWKEKRKDILKRDNNECQYCKQAGGFAAAEAVHHIKHLRDHIYLALTDDNLISLCKSCHNIEHPEKIHPAASKGFVNIERW